MKRYLTHLLIVGSLFAGTYDDPYAPQLLSSASKKQALDPFMHGNFLKIQRFDALSYEDGSLDSDSEDNLELIIRTINKYKQDKIIMKVKVIGHSRERTDDENELAAKSDTYASSIIDMFSTSFSANDAEDMSNDYALDVVDILTANEVPESIIVKEYRSGKDLAYTTTDDGIDLSNRVMVSIYILAALNESVDDDKDGVLNLHDKCPNTSIGVQVNSIGCERDSDGDGVYDRLDQCPNTPSGVTVNDKGCPLDSDGDGVFDYKDHCPDIVSDFKVDSRGCPVLKELRLNFANKSSAIPTDNYQDVEEFALFLKANPTYNVQVVGHTDSVGEKNDNMILSFSRANAVKTALVYEGISADRIKALGRGELEPIKSNRTADGRAYNRRIEVKLFK